MSAGWGRHTHSWVSNTRTHTHCFNIPPFPSSLPFPPFACLRFPPFKQTQELARKRRKIPESEYKDGPDGLRYYDLVVGTGAEPKQGDRVAIHFGERGFGWWWWWWCVGVKQWWCRVAGQHQSRHTCVHTWHVSNCLPVLCLSLPSLYLFGAATGVCNVMATHSRRQVPQW